MSADIKNTGRKKRDSPDTILKVKNLKTYFFTGRGVVKAVDDISFDLRKGESLCLVGESGCGKTTAALSILGLIERPGKTIAGEIFYYDQDFLKYSPEQLRKIRGRKIAMIFQDPESSLNPVFTIGDQITEQIKLHLGLNDRQAREKAIGLMKQVGIPGTERRIDDYPHQFSGGMKQRAMIAMALSCEPEILIADEPATALDVTIQAQILDIFQDLKEERHMSNIFITHDLGVVAEVADKIVVMYGGRVAEAGTVLDIFDDPRHPYTVGLIDCLPDVSRTKGRLTFIPGTIPSLVEPPEGCIFHPRCQKTMSICMEERPPEVTISEEHSVVCHLYSHHE
ncbi:ABC transporter ATP-binding protein [Chloroflexota bacterium]